MVVWRSKYDNGGDREERKREGAKRNEECFISFLNNKIIIIKIKNKDKKVISYRLNWKL